MLTKFSVTNFKNFDSKIILDLSRVSNYDFNTDVISKDIVSKGLIYGTNGIGKSNLCLAIFDIVLHLTDDKHIVPSKYYPFYLNLRSDKPCAEFEYEFVFGKKKVLYSYKKDQDMRLTEECLAIDGEDVLYYDFAKADGFMTLKGTETLNFKSRDSDISRVLFVDKNTILNSDDDNCAAFKAFTKFVNNMLLFCSSSDTQYQGFSYGYGTIDEKIIRGKKTKQLEKFLKEHGMVYDLREDDFTGIPKLYCYFKETDRLVPFGKIASAGAKSLAIFFYWYTMMEKASFVMIDEFDAFYHFRLSKYIVTLLERLPNTQVFLTTHNTDLLSNDLLRPDCYFLMQSGKIDSMEDLSDIRIRPEHNLQKMYKSGIFDEQP